MKSVLSGQWHTWAVSEGVCVRARGQAGLPLAVGSRETLRCSTVVGSRKDPASSKLGLASETGPSTRDRNADLGVIRLRF